LTADRLWQPHSDDFAEKERHVSVSSKAYYESLLLQHNTHHQIAAASAVYNVTMTPNPYDEDNMASLMIAQVIVAANDYDGDGLSGRIDKVIYPPNEDRRRINAMTMKEKRSALTPEIISQQWGIGFDKAKRTLQATTQAGICHVLAPGKRKVCQCLDHMKFLNLRGQFYTDTMFSKVKFTRGHKTAPVFTNSHGYDRFYPLPSKRESTDVFYLQCRYPAVTHI
jgi:hypothetical protein